MSEFARKLREVDRHMRHESVQFADLRHHEERIADLLDALDARVRALEEKFVGTTATLDSISLPEPSRETIVAAQTIRAAVLAERERCARMVEKCLGDSDFAAEIRRGA